MCCQWVAVISLRHGVGAACSQPESIQTLKLSDTMLVISWYQWGLRCQSPSNLKPLFALFGMKSFFCISDLLILICAKTIIYHKIFAEKQ